MFAVQELWCCVGGRGDGSAGWVETHGRGEERLRPARWRFKPRLLLEAGGGVEEA